MDVSSLSIKQAADGLANREFTSVELTKGVLERIEKRNSEINAYISVQAESALEAAAAADAKRADGESHPLCGIPFGVKDSICTKGSRSTAAAKILDTYIPPYTATVIDKIQSTGAVLVGGQNCDAFGHGASTENSMYGVVKNPHDVTKVAGGSSGGSAAALADNQCLFSIAEDTGGSIRQPASFCGLVGLRPSYGRNSRYGVMPMASSLDTVGPMTKTVEDLAIVMQTMAGHDSKDATTVPDIVPDYTKLLGQDIFGLKIGIPKEYMELEGLDPEVKEATEAVMTALQNAGAELIEVSLPHTKYAISVYYIIVPCEDSSNMARFDGIRYGVRTPDADSLYDVYAKSRSAGMPDEVKRRIMVGTYSLSAGYYDQYYRRAQKVRTLIRRDFDEAFKHVDVLLTPTSPYPAWGIGEKSKDVLAMYLSDVYVSPAAVAGIPALSMPAGSTKDGLPIGIQFMGPRLSEDRLMHVAHYFEQL